MSQLSPDSSNFQAIPFGKIERVGQRSLLYQDLFCVSWLLGRFCNYSCSYCWPYASSRKKDHRSLAIIIKTLDEIKRQARERGFNSFHFSFSGGEPTFHPDYLNILRHYVSDHSLCNYQSLHMTSNISRPISWFEEYAAITSKLHRVSITASFHKEFAKKDEFRDKLIFLQEQDIQVTVNMVLPPAQFEDLWQDALFFHNAGINVTLKPQSDPTASFVVDGYSNDQLERMQQGLPQRNYTLSRLQRLKKPSMRPKKQTSQSNQSQQNPNSKPQAPAVLQVELTENNGQAWYIDQAERFNAFGFNKFKGWDCSSGFRSIIIREPDGVIKRSYSCHDEPLGHIERGFELFKSAKVCVTPSCVSSADSKIPKRKAGSRLPLWPLELKSQHVAESFSSEAPEKSGLASGDSSVEADHREPPDVQHQ